ncbi:DUF4184 family protein [Rossellomorea sp. NPDC077527]|uniref:DUF4184 family protein n=1 Tax=Rossellomorea sp. NPDC077527 TaxID=3364510 RepID=UPI0037CBDBDF
MKKEPRDLSPWLFRSNSGKTLKMIVFIYSSLFGMFTHVAWDSFTHANGYMVMQFPSTFANTYNIFGYAIPLYKVLQHGSTFIGILSIIGYMFLRALSQKRTNTNVLTGQKIMFWSSLFLSTLLFVFLWYLIDYVPVLSYGFMVVRIIDSFLISLLLVSILLKFNPMSSWK